MGRLYQYIPSINSPIPIPILLLLLCCCLAANQGKMEEGGMKKGMPISNDVWHNLDKKNRMNRLAENAHEFISGDVPVQSYGEEEGQEENHQKQASSIGREVIMPLPLPPSSMLMLLEGNDKQPPRFMFGQWGECSSSCGPGIRSRSVDCMAKEAISGQMIKLPDYECQGQSRPEQFHSCQSVPCPARLGAAPQTIRSLAQPFPQTVQNGGQKEASGGGGGGGYRWQHGKWTLCSATCLGGRQKSAVLCVELATGQSVSLSKCDQLAKEIGPKPTELVRGCNRHSCPPQWEISPWSACSHSCGGGLRTRRIRCVRAVSRGGASSTLILPDGQCPDQRPVNEEPCGMVDCPPEWTVGNWGQCSTSCGPGEQQRTLSCLRRNSLGQVEEYPAGECANNSTPGERPPPTTRLCDLGECQSSGNGNSVQRPNYSLKMPVAYAEPKIEEISPHPHPPHPQSLALMNPAKDQPLEGGGGGGNEEMEEEEDKSGGGRLTLRVGGFANLYEGTSVKVKCPIRGRGTAGGGDPRRPPVIWTKNGRPLMQNGRLKVSQNGALRIFKARQKDAGVYACQTVNDGQQQGNVTLRFKPNGEWMRKEEGEEEEGEEEEKAGRQSGKHAAKQLLQRVRDSLFALDEHSLLRRLSSINDPSQIRVDFAISDWGQCEQPECEQKEGVQVRSLKCQIHVGQEAAYLDDAICEAFGIPRPVSSQPCLDGQCPRWEAGPWTDCATQSRCVRQATALQKREVRCTFGNGTETSPLLCQRKTRPKLKKECQNANCWAEWRPSVWGKCSKKCGDGGVQMRLLRCVWRGTRKPAGPNCEPTVRPAAIRACQPKKPLPECQHDDDNNNNNDGGVDGRGGEGRAAAADENKTATKGSGERDGEVHGYNGGGDKFKTAALRHLCEDQSRFCDILRLFQTCDQPRIRAQCCFSCRQLQKANGKGPPFAK